MITLTSLAFAHGSDANEAHDVPFPPDSQRPTESAAAEAPTGRASGIQFSMGNLSDRDLVDRARQGDQAAFGLLVRRHHARIFRIAVHMLRARAEAEDIAQETFVRAYRALANFDGRSEPYTWLYRIAVNLSLNVIRARKTARASSASDASDPRLDAIVSEARSLQGGAESDPRASASRKQLYSALCEGIDTLSETLRTTLILVCIDGCSHEDAAQVLGAPEGTIAWRIHEARRKLREFMSARGFDLEGDVT